MKYEKTFDFQERKEKCTGRLIIDEKCNCGALRTEHQPRYAPGHGPCHRTGCRQFTWSENVYSAKAGL